MMKKIFGTMVILAVIGVVAFFLWKANKVNDATPINNDTVIVPTNTVEEQPVGEESEMAGYTNNEYKFSFEYSADFKKLSEDDNARLPWSFESTRPGARLVSVELPKEFAAQTNFSEATVSVGVTNDATEVAACIIGDTEPAEKKVINGATFVKTTSSDAGAGNLYETVSYRIVRDGVCMALEQTIHSTNIGNYAPEQGIKEFDKAKVQATLDEVINSFNFIK